MTPIERIAAERQRQIEKGWIPRHDDYHKNGEIAQAAIGHLTAGDQAWRFPPKQRQQYYQHIKHMHMPADWPITEHSSDDHLIIAGALIVAELERRARARDNVQQR